MAAATLVVGLAGCGGPSESEDREAITAVLIENELVVEGRCDRIYTDAYLAENWNENVTAYGGDTPLEKCAATPPVAGVTEADVAISGIAVDGDTAVATTRVRAQAPVTFRLERDGDDWRIAGFVD